MKNIHFFSIYSKLIGFTLLAFLFLHCESDDDGFSPNDRSVIYWLDVSQEDVFRLRTDGVRLGDIIGNNLQNVTDIEMEEGDGVRVIYFKGGSSVNDRIQALDLDSGDASSRIDRDGATIGEFRVTQSNIFWVETESPGSGTLFSSTKQGQLIQELGKIDAPDFSTIAYYKIAPASQEVFYAVESCNTDGFIAKYNYETGETTQLVTMDGTEGITTIELDEAAGNLYWTTNEKCSGGLNQEWKIYRSDIDGNNVTLLKMVTTDNPEDKVDDLELGPDGDRMYWKKGNGVNSFRLNNPSTDFVVFTATTNVFDFEIK